MGWQGLFIVAGVGVLIIAAGIGFQILQLIVSIIQRKQNLDTTGDPWNGRTLEWSTTSPAPVYNFALLPDVHDRDEFWAMKQPGAIAAAKPKYTDIQVPKNSPIGVFIAAAAFTFGFAVIWHIWWLMAAGLLAVVTLVIIRTTDDDTERTITAAEVATIEAGAAARRHA
jgi:cytochrome o ubiquinol oxidase subunit 1